MKQISFKIYEFSELSQTAQKTAIENLRNQIAEVLTDFDADEYRGCLKKLEDVLSIEVYDWEVNSWRYNFRFRFTSRWCGLDDNPRFLCRYLNDLYFQLSKGKYYSKIVKDKDGKYTYKSRRGHAVREPWSCCLTGCWTDFALDDAMKNRFEAVRAGKTIEEFVNDILENFFTQWKEDIEATYTDEAVQEHIEANEYEFYEDGRPY